MTIRKEIVKWIELVSHGDSPSYHVIIKNFQINGVNKIQFSFYLLFFLFLHSLQLPFHTFSFACDFTYKMHKKCLYNK